MDLGIQVSNFKLRRFASLTIAILAVVAGSFLLGRSQAVPQVSAAQMEVLTGSLAAPPDRATDLTAQRSVSQSITDEPGTMAAAVDYFLKIDGIEGESTDSRRGGEIIIESWSWGETNSGHSAGGGGGAGKVSMQDFHFVMKANKASPKLMLAVATGKHLKEATLTGVRRTDGEQFLEIRLSDLLVSSYQTGGSSGDVVPTDQISLNFTKIEFTFWPELPDGTLGAPVKAGYDLKANKKV